MSNPCEIVEALARATSSTPGTEIVVVAANAARADSAVFLGITPAALVSVGETSVDTPETDAYALLTSSAEATGTVVGLSTRVVQVASESAVATSDMEVAAYNLVVEEATATSTLDAALPIVLCADEVTATAREVGLVIKMGDVVQSVASASSSVLLGAQELVEVEATATSAAPFEVHASALVAEAADASDVVTASAVAQLLTTESAALSDTTVTAAATSALAENSAVATDDALYKNPGAVAWVLNTETTAVSWYENFDFESITQTPDKVLGAGRDGIYLMSGTTDAGDAIDARVTSGFYDFGEMQAKRLDALWFGYTSAGVFAVDVETYGSGYGPYTYTLQQRDAVAPRNSRVTPGKGLRGRFWRFTLRNVAGADFTINSAVADVAVSPRRI